MWDNGKDTHDKDITDTPELAFYEKDGRSKNALNRDLSHLIVRDGKGGGRDT